MPCSAWFIRTAAMSAGLAIRQQPWPWVHVDRLVKHRVLRLRWLAQEGWRRLPLLLMVVVLVGSACQLMQGVLYPRIKSAIARLVTVQHAWIVQNLTHCKGSGKHAVWTLKARYLCMGWLVISWQHAVQGLICARRRVCLSRRITQAQALQH